MTGILSLIIFGATLGKALPNQKRTTPCPYHRNENVLEPLIKDEYVVQLRPGYSLDEHFQFVGYNLSAESEDFDFMEQLNAYGIRIDEDTLHKKIRYDPGVRRVSHNRALNLEQLSHNSRGHINESIISTPLEKRWHTRHSLEHVSVKMLNNWDKLLGPPNFDGADTLWDAGKGVDVYVMDGGIAHNHELFARHGHIRSLRDGKRYTDKDGNRIHGTAIAGVIAWNAPWVTIVDVQVLTEGGNYRRIIGALNDIIVDHKQFSAGPDPPNWQFKGSVINMSFGSNDDPIFQSAIQDAIAAGIVVVTSSGNANENKGSRPCGYDNVICVGAVAKDYRKTAYSNYDKGVTVFAPGHDIYVPGVESSKSYHYTWGTSFASPAVAAMMAHYIGFEAIKDDALKAISRLKQNWHRDMLTDAVPNIFAHSGLKHPLKGPNCPYNGPEFCGQSTGSVLDESGIDPNTPEEESTFMDEPSVPNPPSETQAPCPIGCTCGSLGIPLCT